MPRDADTIRHQRASGLLRLRMGPRGLASLHHRAPLRVLFPDGERGSAPEAAVANVAGGLAGGDEVLAEIALEAGARATLTGAAAEKIYRSLGEDTRIATRLALGEGAVLEWLPQETILFEGARLDRRMEVSLAPGARLLATEMLVFGRVARGERFATGFLRDAWRVRGPDGLLWADALRLDDPAAQIAAAFGLAGAEACGLLLLAAPDAAAQREAARDATGGQATLVRPGLLLLRWLGAAAEVRAGLRRALPMLRAAALGGPAALPKLWTC
jgi:urease accessory protein